MSPPLSRYQNEALLSPAIGVDRHLTYEGVNYQAEAKRLRDREIEDRRKAALPSFQRKLPGTKKTKAMNRLFEYGGSQDIEFRAI
jgi:hypothetical protein